MNRVILLATFGVPFCLSAGTAADARRGSDFFRTQFCINCHAVQGTAANGTFGPDLTHLMSRDTIASGAAPNTEEELRRWVENPDSIKPGSKMPAMGLDKQQLDEVTAYLVSLR